MWRSLAAIALVCALALPAGAQPRHKGGHDKSWSGKNWGGHQRGPSHHGGRDVSGAFWGGVLGGWIAQALRPGREGEDVEGDYKDDALVPWSDEWFAFCTRRYRSFDPRTGRYLSFDGNTYFCQRRD
jgi:hypothetical protein